jgi:microcin C transport system substrate-binding protein
MSRTLATLLALSLALAAPAGAQQAPAEAPAAPKPSHGISLYGDLKYPGGFTHYDYVNPDAPKGGTLRLAATDGFDSLNPYIVRGRPAEGLGYLYETLTVKSEDEPSSEYGLVAQTINAAPDHSWVEFVLRPEARFHDGKKIGADDVVWSFETLRDKGAPAYRFYYKNVAKVEALAPDRVRFTFDAPGNRELPMIMGELPVLPKHYFATHEFDATTMEPPLGSGPYKIASIDPGRSITWERVPDYWGKDLAVNRGRYNFDRIRYDYYRDQIVAFEAFKGRRFDAWVESSARQWATAYDIPQVKDGRVVREVLPVERVAPLQGFYMNARRPQFADRRVRQALGLAFDFEWANKNLFYDQYTRTSSYFENSELAAKGAPSAEELALLEPFRGKLPPEVFGPAYEAPKSDGSGADRANLRKARELLAEAGWTVKERKLVGPDGNQMRVEILLDNPLFERIVAPYLQNLARLGIDAAQRTVDSAQYQNRLDDYDFDMIVGVVAQSLSPGNEQRIYWSSAAADQKGSRNLMGVKDPVVDALIEKIVFAPDRAALVTACHALDRVLTWGHYVVPHWHFNGLRLAAWNRFARPEKGPRYDYGFPDTWWVDPKRDGALGPAG